MLRALAAAATALAAAGCGAAGGGGHRGAQQSAHEASAAAASAPACLPASLDHSAKLPGVPVDVSPTPGTGSADPHTQVSFLGVPASQVHSLSVSGSRTGAHAGRLEAYSQGDGASFVPDRPFASGEEVTVHAAIGAGTGTPVRFSFGVDAPWSTAGVGQFPNPTAPASDYQTFVTLPGVQAPILTATTPDGDPAAGDIITSNGPGPGRYGALIYTPQGRLVWFHQLAGGLVDDDVSVQSYRGQRDLTFWQGKVIALGFGLGEDIVMNSRYQTVATVRAGNGLQADLHEFQIAPHEVAYVTAYNPIRCDLASQQGPRDGVILDTVVEAIDIRTGLVRWEWHALDHVGASESETSPPSGPWDWFHINSIDPEPNGDIFVSARNTWAGYQIAGGSGAILWRLGGLRSSFAMGPGTKTYWQHDGRVLADGDVTFFDDGSDPVHEPQSRAVRIALDMTTHRARLASALTHPGMPVLAASQGNVQTLGDGDTLVGFGGVPQISEFAKSGSLLFDAHLPYDMIFYRSYRFPWSGRPTSPPALVANLDNVGETIVHMSWNGATGVASWRVLAGTRSGSLLAKVTLRSTGFETMAILPTGYTYAAVQALDARGRVLATSHTVAVETYAAADPVGGRSR